MKKILGILIAVMMLVTLTATMVSAEQDISVKLNGEAIAFDVQPQIINDRTMVPLRAIFEALGATVEWDGDTRTVTSTKGEITIKLTIGENKLYKNDAAVELDVPGQIVDDRTLVPVRAISEAYECEVEWEADTRTVLITTPAVEEEKEDAPSSVKLTGENGNTIGILADPANNKDNGFYGNMNLEVVADPDDANNNVFKVSANKAGGQYSYIWNKMEFKAGEKYLVEFDARIVSLYDGTEVDEARVDCCMHYAKKDHGFGGGVVSSSSWTHISVSCTIPEDYTYTAGDDAFGIYGDPKEGQSITYLLDNITVAPITDELQQMLSDKAKAEAEAAATKYKVVSTITFENQEDWTVGKIDNVAFNGSVTGTSQTGDPTLNKKTPVGINIDNVVAIRIKAKIPTGTSMEIFFSTETNRTFAESKKFTVASAGNEVADYIIKTTDNGNWNGMLYGLRVDPVTSAGLDFEVVSVEFLAE